MKRSGFSPPSKPRQGGTLSPGKPLSRKTPLSAGSDAKKTLTRSPPAPKALPSPADEKKALQKRTLRALERAKKAAEDAGVELSEWENEFIDSVGARVKTYGRAFADPDKGAMNGTLSLLQGVKLREIRQKVKKRSPKTDEDPDKEAD
ncbi:MAG: hypothetical protein QM667_05155 [Asticcacaulis sp.]